ncbi:hypothetical protein [Pseudomonas syringae]|uniref:Uncharacterized protein n=1 Tax=Pseudomonas syringae CC1417 TaxID=1357272 RepID=A0AAU8LFE2_PSESX
MGRLLAVTGILLTALYAWLAWWLVGDRISTLQTMSLNEVGDFLAGAFGPLAILWLVLGFFQQGIELRQGSKALNLQAEELRNSVDAQRELVSVTREQVHAELERAAEAKATRAKQIQPFLIGAGGGSSHSGEKHTLNFNFKNLGAPVSRVVFGAHGDFAAITRSVDAMDTGHVVSFVYEIIGSGEGLSDEIQVVYMDADLNVGEQYFVIKVDTSDVLPKLAIERSQNSCVD